MVYNIVYKKSVWRDLKTLGKPEAKKILDKIAKELPEKADTLPVLRGEFAGLRKYRIGNYRVIYALLNEEILILRIAHRKESYR